MSPEDEASFVEFVSARRSHLRRIAYAISGDWHQADDLVQTALIKLYLAWPRMRRDGREEAYARRIIVRANIDDHRRPWRRERQGLPETVRHIPEHTSSDDHHGEIIAALQTLPAMQRKVIVLRYWLDLSIEDTAQELGIKPGTVKSHGFRALDRLENLLSRHASHR